jgi:hypothetical protein
LYGCRLVDPVDPCSLTHMPPMMYVCMYVDVYVVYVLLKKKKKKRKGIGSGYSRLQDTPYNIQFALLTTSLSYVIMGIIGEVGV